MMSKFVPIDDTVSEVKIFCDGAEINNITFTDKYSAEDYFDSYPVDDMADHIELWGFDSFGDWELLDERFEDPSYN